MELQFLGKEREVITLQIEEENFNQRGRSLEGGSMGLAIERNGMCRSSRKALGDISNTSSITNDGVRKEKLAGNRVGKDIVQHKVKLISEELFEVVVKQGRASKRGLGGGDKKRGLDKEDEGMGICQIRGEGGSKMGPATRGLENTEGISLSKFCSGLVYGVHDQNKVLRKRGQKGAAKSKGKRGVDLLAGGGNDTVIVIRVRWLG
ncbi:hypothetical protein LIER_41570 [Lithospermum erythrorhizon]|uniref:Uncharacterized protein n=1 Tax=Lithospermum erythrorhizon TaxID=34254 RepID=A0AAV3RCV9_LITER